MIERELEAVVRKAWTGTEIPLTDANVARLSGLPRADVEHGMRQLMRKGVVDMGVDETGNIVWSVCGVQRAAAGAPATAAPPAAAAVVVASPASTAVASPPSAIVVAPAPKAVVERVEPPPKHVSVTVHGMGARVGLAMDPERKSILLSGGVSLLFGPFGWLYAAPWKEWVPAAAIYVALIALLPKFLIATLLGVLHPTCGVLGMLYAYRYNQTKERTPLLLVDKTVR